MPRADGLRILSLSRLRRQLPRQREPRGRDVPCETICSEEAKGWDRVFCPASSEQANGGSGGISPLVQGPPGGLSVHFPPVESGRFPRKTGFAGAPLDQTASVAGKTGSLRHDGGTRRRCPLCGQTAQALRGLRARDQRLPAQSWISSYSLVPRPRASACFRPSSQQTSGWTVRK